MQKFKVVVWIGKDNQPSQFKIKAGTRGEAMAQVRRAYSQTTVTLKEIQPA